MAESYYKPCAEFYRCNELIEKYWESKQYDKCFAGHMELAEKATPWRNVRSDTSIWKGLASKKICQKPFTGRKEPPRTAIGTVSTILVLSTKTVSALHRIWKKRNTGIKRRHSRDTIWLSKSAENTG